MKNNRIGIVLMMFSSACTCIGQLCWKLSAGENLLYIGTGFLLYGFGAVAMLSAYKFGALSVLQPMLSISYLFAVILASLVLNETITLYKAAGIVVITGSVILIGSSHN
ncbi:MAG: EamA family transporter [Treponema sp.]|jgi:undecaprenyl phosphate-alpha-L-ara4N flippase subunit ArnE|nr:EamA family transporter [Treponema sp.]